MLVLVVFALGLLVALVPAPTFDAYFEHAFAVADGFDAPGEGGRALAHGRVASVGDGVVVIDHVFYENHDKREVSARYVGLESIRVTSGQDVRRGDRIGDGRAKVRIDGTPARRFVRGRRRLFVPAEEPVVVLVDHAHHQAARYERGQRVAVVEIELGQAEGAKEVQGDLKTPKGMYFVTYKHRGAFTGAYGDYYGGHWIKVNYPNAYDAERGVEQGVVERDTAKAIARAWRKRKLPTQKTRLGGGIGFHGWAGAWTRQDPGGLSWGCVVMHNEDITRWFETIPVGAMVVMF